MDIQTIQARFPTQEQAEAAVRKLSFLRGDRFRVERDGSGMSAAAGDEPLEWGGAESAVASPFSLSADIPATIAEQARGVILGAGGEMM